MKVQYILNRLLIDFSQKQQTKSNQGFTLIELLVVVMIIGILTAIAAPSWNALTTRQRLRSVNNQVFQALQTAQAEAKRTKKDINITFTPGTTTETPKYTISTAPNNPVHLSLEGQIKPGMIQIYTVNTQSPATPTITFDYLGTTKNAGFTVVTYLNDSKNSRKCSIVETILGTVRIADGTECPEPK